MTLHLMDVFSVKERTARGYGVVIAALRFLYDRNEQYFLARGHPWTEFFEVNVTKWTSYYTNRSQYVCGQCDFIFTRKEDRTLHKSHYTKDLIHVCSQCDYIFTRKGDLTLHKALLHE